MMLELNDVFHCGLVLGIYGTFIEDPCESPCSTGLALHSSKTRTFLSRVVSCFDSPGMMLWHNTRSWAEGAGPALPWAGHHADQFLSHSCFYLFSAVSPALLFEVDLDLQPTAGRESLLYPCACCPVPEWRSAECQGEGGGARPWLVMSPIYRSKMLVVPWALVPAISFMMPPLMSSAYFA